MLEASRRGQLREPHGYNCAITMLKPPIRPRLSHRYFFSSRSVAAFADPTPDRILKIILHLFYEQILDAP